jgi:Fe2+ transport system protein FeoA
MLLSLDRLPDGQEARLVRLEGERSFRRRLMELGFLPGTRIRVVRRAEIGGVLELEVRRSRLSVRTHEARSVLVEALEGP